jgi:hypothetical protein
MANVYQTNVQIGGTINPSLYNAVGLTAKQMAILQKHVQGFNSLAKQSQASLSGLPPTLQKANAQITQMNSGLITMGNLIPKLVIGDLIASGIRAGIRAIDEMIGKVHDLADEALKVRGQFERSEWALGNILGSRVLGAKLQSQLNQLGRNQFGGIALSETAKQYAAAGVPIQNILGTVKQSANIVAATGGGKEELEQFSQHRLRVWNRGYLDPRALQALGRQGVPLLETLEGMYGQTPFIERNKKGEATKINPAGRESIQAMLTHHKITSEMVDKAFAKMVATGGIAADGMKKHAEIWEGAVEKITQEWKLLEDDFGEVEERMFTPILNWFNSSGIWNSAHEWISQARSWADGVINYFKAYDLSKTLGPTFDNIEIVWAKINKMVEDQFGTFTNPATGNVEKFLKPSTLDQLSQVLDKINQTVERIWNLGSALENLNNRLKPLYDAVNWIIDKLSKIDDILYSKLVPFLGGKIGESPIYGSGQNVSIIQERLDALIKANAPQSEIDKVRESLIKAGGVNKDSTDANTDALNKLTDALDFFNPQFSPSVAGTGGIALGGNYGLHGPLSDKPNETYYEHPDTEGRSSQFGPRGNRLGYGYGVGLGEKIAAQYNAPLGSWITMRLPNGKIITRQRNETSARSRGIEFVSPSTDEKSYGSGRTEILKVSPNKPNESSGDDTLYDLRPKQRGESSEDYNKRLGKSSTGASITNHYHIYAMDSTGVDAVLREHGEKFYENHIRHHRNELSRGAWA